MKTKLLSTSNTKLKKDKIAVFSLEAGRTCPRAGACKQFCYAKKGFFLMPTVKKKRQDNFAASRDTQFANRMAAECLMIKNRIVRIHDSGDFYSVSYLQKWIDVATRTPEKQFYAYTKSVRFFLGKELPPNFRVIFSYGGMDDHLINPKIHRHARIFNSKEELDAAGYADASQSDLVAATTKSLKIGLILH